MAWLRALFSSLFGKRKREEAWNRLDYGKPSREGDDFRDRNQV
jgi:hypothetical protein